MNHLSTYLKKMKNLAPCPFLETSEFLDIYVCGASKFIYVLHSSLSEEEAIKRCTGNRYIDCKNYLEALDRIRVCPFLGRQVLIPSSYIHVCKASKYVHVSFSKISKTQLSRHCTEDRYYDCEYYLNAVNTIENGIKELDRKIEKLAK